MTLNQVMKQLEALGSERMREQNMRHGSGENQFGLKRGDVRKIAKELKSNHELGLQLWDTENVDARFLAILIMKPKQLSAEELDRMVRAEPFTEVADWFYRYIVKKHPEGGAQLDSWLESGDPMAERAAWHLIADLAERSPDTLDLNALLDRIESEMKDAHPAPQWSMNWALSMIGIHHPKLRKRTIAIGEKLEVLKDYPTSKGCVSPYAPICIEEMVRRQQA